MPVRRLDASPDDLQAALDESACLGAWTYDVAADRFRLLPPLANLLGIDPGEAAEGVGLEQALSGLRAEDRLRFENVLYEAGTTGGSFEVELRTRAEPAASRWLRLMGRCGPDPTGGRLLARGLAFDLTERRLERGTPTERAHRQANRLTEHVIAMQGLVADLRNPPLAQLVNRVAVEIGFELARRLQAASSGPRH